MSQRPTLFRHLAILVRLIKISRGHIRVKPEVSARADATYFEALQ